MTVCLTQMFKPEESGRGRAAAAMILFMAAFVLSAHGRIIRANRNSRDKLEIFSNDSFKNASRNIRIKDVEINIDEHAVGFPRNFYIKSLKVYLFKFGTLVLWAGRSRRLRHEGSGLNFYSGLRIVPHLGSLPKSGLSGRGSLSRLADRPSLGQLVEVRPFGPGFLI